MGSGCTRFSDFGSPLSYKLSSGPARWWPFSEIATLASQTLEYFARVLFNMNPRERWTPGRLMTS